MVSGRGIVIGLLVMCFGFLVMITALSPEFLFSLGILDIGAFNTIQFQFRLWGLPLSVFMIIIGFVVMGKFE